MFKELILENLRNVKNFWFGSVYRQYADIERKIMQFDCTNLNVLLFTEIT
jgi:aminopeptidase C